MLAMSNIEYERVSRENKLKALQLQDYQTTISCLKNDNAASQSLIQAQQTQIEDLKKQIKQSHRKMQEARLDREDTQRRYLLVLKRLEGELEESKNKYERLERKVMPLLDHDTVRLKVLNEVQGAHQVELDQKMRANEQLRQQILKLRRESDLQRQKLESRCFELEDELRRIRNSKDKEQGQFSAASFEIGKEIEDRLKKSYEQARKQADYYKEKYFEAEKKYQRKAQKVSFERIKDEY